VNIEVRRHPWLSVIVACRSAFTAIDSEADLLSGPLRGAGLRGLLLLGL